ncbi:mitochondrial ribosomal protein L22 (uL22m) [Andalucia godoyi]|uniref:Mitochondrial ribosomal protein L22 (UL22m) n=1 Tax=Andalucia godoyi TaxID=505711 RepID=A0A8K0AGT3_ANDGO|nr:mitochondrial ribosomal protein L22 (uL22m) [Andalucia godoyi]|eukprot:ANDGO_07972.mRNA.1 mitochondrial ribosomal protein L22 (uL22m)
MFRRLFSSDVLSSVLSNVSSSSASAALSGASSAAAAGAGVAGYVSQAVFRGVKTSPKKLNLLARMVRGMSVPSALAQLDHSPKRHAKTLALAIQSAVSNAGSRSAASADKEKKDLKIVEAYVTKGEYIKRVQFHARGKFGTKHHPSSHLTVRLANIPNLDESAN